jgi:ABC-2 type transport system ATP-binding protein
MEPTHDVLIEATGLTRRYGSRTAVADLNLTLRRGEILGLLGPNGAGKSTTMKMLTGNLAPSAGSVRINGIDIAAEPKKAKQFLGYLPELPPVYPELTVDEYLAFAARLHGIAASGVAAAVAKAKSACALHDVGARLIGNLSKGYQQRVGLAQAIIHEPPVIVLDEPTVGLDPIQIREIRALIATLAQNHSVILSSHILPEIQAVCSRVMIVHHGRVVFQDSLAAMTARTATRLAVQFRRPPAVLDLPGIATVNALAEGRFIVTPQAGVDLREALVQASVQHAWGLLELKTEGHSLEETFVALTAGDAAEATPATLLPEAA